MFVEVLWFCALIPTAINIVDSFSPTCQLSEEGGIVCDKCLPGYTGSQCERYVH